MNRFEINVGLVIVNPKEWKKMLEELRMYRELVAEINSKETPVKPLRNKRYCGKCDLVRLLPQENYCSNCGQRIDWSEEDE